MCKDVSCCQKLEKLKEKPEECTPEQIAECHPDQEGHPCEESIEDKQKIFILVWLLNNQGQLITGSNSGERLKPKPSGYTLNFR